MPARAETSCQRVRKDLAWSVVEILRAIWPWARPYWRYAVAALAAMVVSVTAGLAIPLLTSRVIDQGIATGDSSYVFETIAVMVAISLAAMISSAASSVLSVRLAFNTVTDLRRDLYAQAQRLSFGNYDRLSTGEVLTRLTSDMTRVNQLLTMGLSFVSQIPFLFFGSLLAILAIDPSLVPVVILMLPAIGALVMFILRRSKVLYNAVQQRIDRLNIVVSENIHGAQVTKAFVREDHQTKRIDGIANDLAHQAATVNQLVAALFPTLVCISSLAVAGVIWLGGNNVIDGSLTEGELVAFISYLGMISMPIIMFAFLQPMIAAAAASMNRIEQVLREPPDLPNRDHGARLQETSGEIIFDNVSFCYSRPALEQGSYLEYPSTGPVMPAGGERGAATRDRALHEVSLRIRHGDTVAILGATGSGKSTLVHLLARFYDPTIGCISIGGVDIAYVDEKQLRKYIAIALQEPRLFAGSVAANLRYGLPDASSAQIQKAARDAQAHDFIVELPRGYDSILEPGGSNLSGGQRQRLALARTLVAAPKILILDDSTSAVDMKTEAAIQRSLLSAPDRTTIIVAQRISTALGADEIIVIDCGRVVAQGSHSELLATSALYQAIYSSQLGEPAA